MPLKHLIQSIAFLSDDTMVVGIDDEIWLFYIQKEAPDLEEFGT